MRWSQLEPTKQQEKIIYIYISKTNFKIGKGCEGVYVEPTQIQYKKYDAA